MALYAFAAWLASFINPKVKKLIEGHRDILTTVRNGIKEGDRIVWFHVASLGEFEQGRPLMELVRKNHPEYKILLTFFSPSGYEVRKNYEGADVICYIPFDTKRGANRFLDIVKPEIAIFIKYEFWYFFLTGMRKRGTRIYSVSSIFRDGQIFFRFKNAAKVLRQFDHLFVQNQKSVDLLAGIDIHNTTIVGDTRLDRVMEIHNQAKDLPLVQAFKNGQKTFIAGSSWDPDEHIYLPYFSNHLDWKLIIAPHEIDEPRLARLMKQLEGRKVLRYTDAEKMIAEGGKEAAQQMLKESDVLIVDCFGKLSSIYRYGEIALVGGGFGAGIHNVPEAAVYGIPVLFGPNNKKFNEAQELKECKGAFEYTDEQSFAEVMDQLINDPEYLQQAGKRAGDYINTHTGATLKCYNAIFGEQKAKEKEAE